MGREAASWFSWDRYAGSGTGLLRREASQLWTTVFTPFRSKLEGDGDGERDGDTKSEKEYNAVGRLVG